MTRKKLYLDVSGVRIQSYLSRTTHLRGRRGASAALAEATRLEDQEIRRLFGASLNTEAGEADGVVNLVLDAPDSEEEADRLARDTAGRVFRHLRARLPAAEFQAVWAVDTSYLDAHRTTIGPRLREGDVLSDLPPVSELPYARICERCHLDPARDRVHLGDGERPYLCPDCMMRFAHRTREDARTAEYELQKRLGTPARPKELPELAALGGKDTDRNHVATVFVDGNAFGHFFEKLAHHGRRLSAESKARISRGLNQATRDALAEAAAAVRRPEEDGDMLCVIPYLVGGDDVLLSLPADRAWPFVRHYLRSFTERTKAVRAEADVPGLPPLSASAGLVFAHHKLPFHLVVEDAASCLAAAKRLVHGKKESVAFYDHTAGHPTHALCLADLEEHQSDLDALTALPESGRHALAAHLRHQAPHAAAATEAHLDRLGRRDVVEPFLADQAPIGLQQALDIARWWR
ncbi:MULTISPECIES: Cas10/Cmr2 second palm domain-containing protein [Streptomyces]|uniref:GGDEF domain-containing protein n=2 Tax=Streptomyces TaxID=1883 RepID=A0ABN1NBS7_9ACTN|nr:hypothetical protein [Streptomyces sp. LB8]MDN5383358.1 hypothetical protein [Streptomyces sp. LB8]